MSNLVRRVAAFTVSFFALLSTSSTAYGGQISSTKVALNGGAAIFELYDDPVSIPGCSEQNALGAIAKLEKEGTLYPFGSGCWFALANGQVLVRIRSIETGQMRETLIPSSKFLSASDKSGHAKAKWSYAAAKSRLDDIGLCNACADNVAQYMSKQVTSLCATLANKALDGNGDALRELQSFPQFCRWRY